MLAHPQLVPYRTVLGPSAGTGTDFLLAIIVMRDVIHIYDNTKPSLSPCSMLRQFINADLLFSGIYRSRFFHDTCFIHSLRVPAGTVGDMQPTSGPVSGLFGWVTVCGRVNPLGM